MRIVFILFFVLNISFGQDARKGYVVEYNLPIEVGLTVYSPPLRINKVDNQQIINYSKIEGLLESYLSASNIEWVKSEYLDKNAIIGRDEGHFDAVKKAGIEDYIQIESVYEFNYDQRKMAYVKYSFIYEKLPFPFTGILSLENVSNRWYLSNLLNQGAVYELLRIMRTDFILDCFQGNSKKQIWNTIITDCNNKNNNIILPLLYQKIKSLKESNKLLYDELRDPRLVVKEEKFRNAVLDSDINKYKFKKVLHPFVYDNIEHIIYPIDQKDLVKDEKSVVKYANTPELLLLTDTPIKLLNKVIATTRNGKYYFMKHSEGNKKKVTVVKFENNSYKIAAKNESDNIIELVSMCKVNFLDDILQNKVIDKMKKYITGSDGGINLDLALKYIKENRSSLNPYLDN